MQCGEICAIIQSEFLSQGINQTLHRVYLNVKCNVNILTPFKSIEKDITNQVLLLENVILGKIPETYYNFNNTNKDETAMEIIE